MRRTDPHRTRTVPEPYRTLPYRTYTVPYLKRPVSYRTHTMTYHTILDRYVQYSTVQFSTVTNPSVPYRLLTANILLL